MSHVMIVYKLECFAISKQTEIIATPYQLLQWTPSLFRIIPLNVATHRVGYIKNWAFHLPRFFSKQKELYSAYALVNNGEVLCQCIVTPASTRYDFMKPQDLQFGLVYTMPNHRNRKFANIMVTAIIKKEFKIGRSFWWITELENIYSRRLCERTGFKYVGKAKRTSLLGFSYYSLIDHADKQNSQ